MKLSQNDLYTYGILILLAIMFTTFDLVASSMGQLVITLIFSATTLIVVFVGSHKSRAIQINKGVDKTIDFINANFSCSARILSILDVICSVIALCTGIFYIAVISRVGFAVGLAIKINKYRTIAVAIFVFIFGYLIKRRNKTMGTESKENIFKKIFKWFWANKKSICGTIFGVIAGIVTAIAVNADLILTLPALYIGSFNITALIIGVLVFAGVEVGVAGKGFEAVIQFFKRKEVEDAEKKILTQEKIDAKAKLEAEKIAAEKIAKAKALIEKQKADAEAKAKALAEEEEIKALAEKIKANETAKIETEENKNI